MAALLLLLIVVQGARALICPPNYNEDGNGNCQSVRQTPNNQLTAYRTCGQRNAYIFTIKNAFDNTRGIHLAGDFDNIWIGLTCLSNSRNSCLWDDGTPIGDTSYANFASGHPNLDLGACVYLSAAKGGLWYSASCNDFSAPFVCRATPGVFVPLCIGDANYFQGHCYYSVRGVGYADAHANCQQYYGDLASVHNLGEDSFVRDVAVSNPALLNSTNVYGYIGMTLNNSQWSDNTTIDYSNFGYKNANLGQCVFLSTTTDAVPRGKWINGDCMSMTVGVCKRNITVFPGGCSGQTYIDGQGTLYSPNMPSVNQSMHCEYIFNPDTGSIVTLSFLAMSLDVNSTIKLYNTIFDKSPFATFSGVQNHNWTYYSASNFMKVVYDSPANGFYHDYFIANYGIQKQGPNNCGGNYTKTGRVSGPDTAQNCTYTLNLPPWTCLKFIDIGLQGQDTITIYDGEILPENQVGLIAKYFTYGVQTVALCPYVTNTLNVVTTGISGLDYDLFTMDIATSFQELSPSRLWNTYDNMFPVPEGGRNASYLFDTYTYSKVEEYSFNASPWPFIRVNFTLLNMPFPNNNIILIDGDYTGLVAMAYGLGGPDFSRMSFPYTRSGVLTVGAQFNQVVSTGQLIGYVGEFKHA